MRSFISLPSALLALILLPGAFSQGAQASTTFSLGPETDLLDAAFYANGTRSAWWGSLNNAGTTVAFHAVTYPSFTTEIYLVDLGDPSSWRQLTSGFPHNPQSPISWTPDDSRIYAQMWIDVDTGTMMPGGSRRGIQLLINSDVRFTRLPTDNWLIMRTNQLTGGAWNLVMIPILPGGQSDNSREPVVVTNFGPGELTGQAPRPEISADGTRVAFEDYGAGTPDIGDIYTLADLQAILDAPRIDETYISTLAPTTLADPQIVPIRAGGTPDNYAGSPRFTQDKEYLLYGEDWNNVFRNANFFGTIALADFDVMISKSDGTGSANRIALPGNQGVPTPTGGGTRILYINSVAAGAMSGFQNINFHLFITTFEAANSLENDSQPLPESATEVVIGGQTVPLPPEIVLTDSAVQLTAPVQANDASGTSIALPQDQVVNFPPGTASKSVSITTPVDPVTPAQLPPNAPVDAIPVVREFGPAGTQFFPPIEITITYTDAEIIGLNESTLRPYLFNSDTGIFDLPVPLSDIVARDTVNNTITFRVSHFSVYGLGGSFGAGVPALSYSMLLSLALLSALLGAGYIYRLRWHSSNIRQS